VIGRWQSRDPLPNAERKQGLNLYEYVQNRPLFLTDPLGLWTIGIGVQAGGGWVGGGQVSVGIYVGHNSGDSFSSGWSAGLLFSGGGGPYAGMGGEAGGFIAGSNAQNVCQLKGTGWSAGGSAGEVFGGGLDKTGGINYQWDAGYGGEGQNGGIQNVSQGPTGWNLHGGLTGGVVPGEGHGFGTWTGGLTVGH
jgi:hypothetical protein